MSDALNLQTYRGLEVCDIIPAGCMGVLMADDGFAPHLRCGEIAVIDTADKSTEAGELYLLTFASGRGPVRQVVQLRASGFAGRCNGLWYAFAFRGQARPNTTTIDGPLQPEYWPDKCLGRVVGVMPVNILRSA